MGIGPIWGINSVSPFILSCFKISKIVFYKSLSFGFITYNIMFLTGNIWRRSGQQLHWWHSNWRLLFESRVMFLWWVLNNCTSVTYFKHRQTTSVRVAVVVNEHPYFVYLINTDSIKSKCLHKNSSIGRWKKKHNNENLYFSRCNRSRLLRQRISVFLIAYRTVKKGFSVGWLTTSGKKYLR